MSERKSLEQFYTIQYVAERLGVHERTVRRWIKDKKLAAHQFNALVRIEHGDLRAFLALHRH